MTKHIHDPECKALVRRIEGKSYHELVWECVPGCLIGGKDASI